MLIGILTSLLASVILEGGNLYIDYLEQKKSLEEHLKSAFENAIDTWTENKKIAKVEKQNYNNYKTLLLSILVNGYNPDLDESQKELIQIFEEKVASNSILWNEIQILWNKNQASQTQEIIKCLNEVINQQQIITKNFDSINTDLELIKEKLGIKEFAITNSYEEIDISSNHTSLRSLTIDELIGQMNHSNKWLMLTGEILTGKTQLLKLIVGRYERDLIWISIQENTSYFEELIKKILQKLNVSTIEEIYDIFDKRQFLLVIDNLPKLSKNDTKFLGFLQMIFSYDFILISASNYELPTLYKETFLDICFNSKIPLFINDEVKEIILTYIDDEKIANTFSKLIFTMSGGNPALTSALCLYLHEQNWQIGIDEFTQIFTNNYSPEFRIEINDLINKTISDISTQELLYRLQIINGSFNEATAILIGDVTPEIERINDKFLSLIGLWIKRLGIDSFKVSSLLSMANKGRPTVSKSVYRSVNFLLGKDIIKNKSLILSDVTTAILYFKNAEEYEYAGILLVKSLQFALEYPNIFKNNLIFKFWIDIALPEQMSFKLQIAIRVLQLINTEQNNLNNYYLINDLEVITEKASINGEDTYLPNMYLGTLALKNKIEEKSSHFLLKAYKESRKSDNYTELFSIDDPALMSNTLWISFIHIDNEKDIDEWFESVKQMTNEEKEQFLSLEFAEICSSLQPHQYIKKFIATERDWSKALYFLNLIYNKALGLNIRSIALYTLNEIIIIHGEILNSPDIAYDNFEKNISIFAESDFSKTILYSTISKILYNSKNEKLLPIIQKLTELQEISINENYPEKIDGLITLFLFYSDKTDFSKALYFADKAKSYALNNENISQLNQIKLIGEYSISLWINEKRQESLIELSKGFKILLNTYDNSMSYQILIVRYGIAIRYYNLEISGKKDDTDNVEPYIGIFISNNNDEKLAKVYHPQRDFFNSFFIFSSFDILKNTEYAKEWAIITYNQSKRLEYNPYSIIMLELSPYLSKQHMYSDVVDMYCQNNSFIRKYNAGEIDYQELGKKLRPEAKLIDFPDPIERRFTEFEDDFLLEYYIIPAIFDALTIYLADEEKGINHLISIKNKLIEYLNSCNKIKLINGAVEIISHFIKNKKLIDINGLSNKYSENNKVLATIIYLLASVYRG